MAKLLKHLEVGDVTAFSDDFLHCNPFDSADLYQNSAIFVPRRDFDLVDQATGFPCSLLLFIPALSKAQVLGLLVSHPSLQAVLQNVRSQLLCRRIRARNAHCQLQYRYVLCHFNLKLSYY
jgi:hypothetical protein